MEGKLAADSSISCKYSASEFVLVLKVVVLDEELNSTPNDDIFKWGHRPKNRYLD
jgi:hypothetical protein